MLIQQIAPVAETEFAPVFVALELSRSKWLVGVGAPQKGTVRRHQVQGGDLYGLLELLRRIGAEEEKRGGLPVKVHVCFEAGRDGHWLYRALKLAGYEAYEIEPASGAVDRRAWPTPSRAGSTSTSSCARLARFVRGELDACRIVAVPSEAEEDAKLPRSASTSVWSRNRPPTADVSEPARRRAIYRPGAVSLPKRRRGARPGDRQGRRQTGAQGDDRTLLALGAAPARQRALPVVPRARRRQEGARAAHRHRRHGAQARRCALALPRDRRHSRRGGLETRLKPTEKRAVLPTKAVRLVRDGIRDRPPTLSSSPRERLVRSIPGLAT